MEIAEAHIFSNSRSLLGNERLLEVLYQIWHPKVRLKSKQKKPGCILTGTDDGCIAHGSLLQSTRIYLINGTCVCVCVCAVCMDGTPPAYHLDPGSGAGNNSWIVNLEVSSS